MKALACEDQDLGWFTERTGHQLAPGARGIKAVDGARRIRGVVVYDSFTLNQARMHVALDTPAAVRCLLGLAFRYPMEECGYGVVTGLVVRGTRSHRLALALGFRETGSVRDGWSVGSDLVYLEQRREECRYLSAPPVSEGARKMVGLRLVGG